MDQSTVRLNPVIGGGLLISRDLIFTSKVTSTAQALGTQVQVAGSAAAARAAIERLKPRLVLVDLSAGDLVAPDRLKEYRTLAIAPIYLLAFGPHVETATLQAARDAGCDSVIPRSKFASQLTEILTTYLPKAPASPS